MHERLAARRETVMAGRKDALLDSLEDLASQLELLGGRLDVEMLRKAASAYREARQAIMTAHSSEAELLRLFRALNESAGEIGALLQRYGIGIGAKLPQAPGHPEEDRN
jgi:hypothetical protein